MIGEFINKIIESFPEETPLFFYSSLFQGNAALVTLTAMFVIYKKQGFDFALTRIERIIIDYLTNSCKISINYGDIHELEVYKEEMCKDLDRDIKSKLKELQESTQWRARFKELKDLKKEFGIFIQEAIRPMVNIFILLIVSIFILPFSGLIHEFPYIELILYIIFLVFQGISLIALFSFIKKRFKLAD